MQQIEKKNPRVVLCEFFVLAWEQNHSAARVAAHLLLSMYNGNRFKVDVTDLRLLDTKMLRDALALMQFDARPQMEVHQWLNKMYGRTDFGQRFEHLAHKWGVQGKCQKKYLEPLAPVKFAVPSQEGAAA